MWLRFHCASLLFIVFICYDCNKVPKWFLIFQTFSLYSLFPYILQIMITNAFSYQFNEKLSPIYHPTSHLTARRLKNMLKKEYCTHARKRVNILGVPEYMTLFTLWLTFDLIYLTKIQKHYHNGLWCKFTLNKFANKF